MVERGKKGPPAPPASPASGAPEGAGHGRLVAGLAIGGAVLIGAVVLFGDRRPPTAADAGPGAAGPASAAPSAVAPATPLPAGPAALPTDAASPWPADLPPLPRVGFIPPRSPALIQATYEFAARHPEVLQYMPCFCGCERHGHDSNVDCFISGRDPSGRPLWDAHAMG